MAFGVRGGNWTVSEGFLPGAAGRTGLVGDVLVNGLWWGYGLTVAAGDSH